MDKLIRSNRLQFEKSELFIKIYRQQSGLQFIKIAQQLDGCKNSISINVNNLEEIFETLKNFREEIALNQKIQDRFLVNEADGEKIIKIFLKGITIKDLSLQFPYKEDIIEKFLIKNDIEIIEGLTVPKNHFRFRKFKKNR